MTEETEEVMSDCILVGGPADGMEFAAPDDAQFVTADDPDADDDEFDPSAPMYKRVGLQDEQGRSQFLWDEGPMGLQTEAENE